MRRILLAIALTLTVAASTSAQQITSSAPRIRMAILAIRAVPVLTTDTAVTINLVNETTGNTTGQTQYPITSGKKLRIQAIHISLTPTSTTVGLVQVRLLTNAPGFNCVVGSPIVMQWEIGNPGNATQVANAANARIEQMFPDGIEISGTAAKVCLSMNALGAAAQAVTITLLGYEY